MSDLIAELAQVSEKRDVAQRRLGELQSAQSALDNQRATIMSICERLSVTPSREAVEAAIAKTEAELASMISMIDGEIKKNE